MNELHIPQRIDEILNILNGLPLRGYEQWNPVVEVMKRLAAISQDVQKLEQEQAKDKDEQMKLEVAVDGEDGQAD